MTTDRVETATGSAGDFVEFRVAGETGKGEYRCSECSYGITVHRRLPVCPMCSGSAWEQADWSPFTRAASLQ